VCGSAGGGEGAQCLLQLRAGAVASKQVASGREPHVILRLQAWL